MKYICIYVYIYIYIYIYILYSQDIEKSQHFRVSLSVQFHLRNQSAGTSQKYLKQSVEDGARLFAISLARNVGEIPLFLIN